MVRKIEQKAKQVFVHATVDRPGLLSGGMSLNVPATRSKAIDKANPFGAKIDEIVKVFGNNCEYVVLPSFASTEAILQLKESFKSAGFTAPWCILKVDSKEIYEKYESYMPVIDGVLISSCLLYTSPSPRDS